MIRFRSTLPVLLLLFPVATAAGEGRDLTLSSIAAGAADRRLGPDAFASGPAGILAALSGVESFPLPCATPLVLYVRSDEPASEALRQAGAAIATPPVLPDERTLLTRDGRFLLRYSAPGGPAGVPAADRDRNGVPDIVDRIAESLLASRSYLVATLGFPEPASPLEVFLMRLGHGLEGMTIPGQSAAASPPFLILDAGLSSDRILGAVLHQVAHASLLALAPRTAPWWTEATAAYLTLMATGDLDGQQAALRARQQTPGRGLDADDLGLMQGGLLWPLFLAERVGDPAVVRQIWEEIAGQGIDPLAAVDHVLRRVAGLSLADAFREQVAWTLFTAGRDDGRHYSIGRALPEAVLTTIGPGLPFEIGPVEPVEPVGSIAFRIPSDGREGSLDLEIDAEGGRPGADLLVTYKAAGERPVLVPVALDDRGTGRVAIPWSDAREAWLVLRNSASEPGAGASRFAIRGTHDPFTPFDLAAFTAQAVGPTLLLEWTTASESGLLFWNIYRSEKPTGPYARLNSVAIPANGDGSADTGYVFVDDTVAGGRRYYYQIEGVTQLGLVQRSHLASGRTRPSR